MKPLPNWHQALEEQMELHQWCLTSGGEAFLKGFFAFFFKGDVLMQARPLMIDKHVNAFVSCIYRGDTCYVTEDMKMVIEAASLSMPEELTLHPKDLLSPCGFVLFAEPVLGEDVGGVPTTCHGFAWELMTIAHVEEDSFDIARYEEVIIWFLVDTWDERDAVSADMRKRALADEIVLPRISLSHCFVVPCDGERHFSWFESEISTKSATAQAFVRNCVRMFLAFHLVSQEKIADKVVQIPTRATRKRAVKWDRHNDRYISLITLRRRSVKRDEPQLIDWTHRWVVTGHWRKQWYPKDMVHRWKYIPEYIKGPEDKPLLIRERRVFNLER